VRSQYYIEGNCVCDNGVWRNIIETYIMISNIINLKTDEGKLLLIWFSEEEEVIILILKKIENDMINVIEMKANEDANDEIMMTEK